MRLEEEGGVGLIPLHPREDREGETPGCPHGSSRSPGLRCAPRAQAAADIRRRKKSLPAVYAMSQAEGAALGELRRVYGKAELSGDDVTSVLLTMDAVGAHGYCAAMAQARMDEALEALAQLQLDAGAAMELREAALFLLDRDF